MLVGSDDQSYLHLALNLKKHFLMYLGNSYSTPRKSECDNLHKHSKLNLCALLLSYCLILIYIFLQFCIVDFGFAPLWEKWEVMGRH